MPLTDTEIRDRLDLNHIARAAAAAGPRLYVAGAVRVNLTPGDGTLYRIAVIHRSTTCWADQDGWVQTRDHWVTVLGLGDSYEWGGGEVHPDYAAGKWGRGNRWTGNVVAEFLTRLGEELARYVRLVNR